MKRWKPKTNDKFWIVVDTGPNELGLLLESDDCESYYKFNKDVYPLGYFRTKKEAQAQIKKIYALFWGK